MSLTVLLKFVLLLSFSKEYQTGFFKASLIVVLTVGSQAKNLLSNFTYSTYKNF